MQLFAQVCREWEATALQVNKDVRLALIRIGVVLGKDGGALGISDFLLSLYLSPPTHMPFISKIKREFQTNLVSLIYLLVKSR